MVICKIVSLESALKPSSRLRSYVTSEILSPKQSSRPRATASRPDMLDTWLDRVEADSQVTDNFKRDICSTDEVAPMQQPSHC